MILGLRNHQGSKSAVSVPVFRSTVLLYSGNFLFVSVEAPFGEEGNALSVWCSSWGCLSPQETRTLSL